MRTFADRIRHTILFELIALLLAAFGGSWITGHSVQEIGSLSLIFSALAMVWNLVYNWLFDLWDMKYRGMAHRGPGLRVVHAILFEAVLMTVGLFITAWWLNIGYIDALILDLGFSAFFLCYAYVFNWGYDQVFPIPGQSKEERAAT